MSDIDGFDRAAYLHDNAEPKEPHPLDQWTCEECGEEMQYRLAEDHRCETEEAGEEE